MAAAWLSALELGSSLYDDAMIALQRLMGIWPSFTTGDDDRLHLC